MVKQISRVYKDPILSSKPPQYTKGLGSNISRPVAKLLFSSSMYNIDGCLWMMALRVLTCDELDAYESLLDVEPDEERRREERMLEKERDWKRVVRIFADVREKIVDGVEGSVVVAGQLNLRVIWCV